MVTLSTEESVHLINNLRLVGELLEKEFDHIGDSIDCVYRAADIIRELNEESGE